MPKIEGFQVKNYRALKNITLGGTSWNQSQDVDKLTPLTVVIGKNGAGKTSLFDAFGFLGDCIKKGVEEACDAEHRGGFDNIYSRESKGPIEFVVYYREATDQPPITYELHIDKDKQERVYVKSERLRQRRINTYGQPYTFLKLDEGKGEVWKGEKSGYDEEKQQKIGSRYDRVPIELEDNRKLGIATLGNLVEHPRISKFRFFLENWYLSYFSPDATRILPPAGPQKHLNRDGSNLSNVVQFMERDHKKNFQKILDQIAQKIPGIGKITVKTTDDKRLLICFSNNGFKDPFYARVTSDGTLKIFTYLLLLADPSPPPFMCIEEPENGLYNNLLEDLAQEFRSHAQDDKSQVFVTTHQPYFVDALSPSEVWILEKGKDGFSTIRRASSDPRIQKMVDSGFPLGALWYSNHLEQRRTV